jgi:type I restriction enzyme S subunit
MSVPTKHPIDWKRKTFNDALSVLKDGTHFSPKAFGGKNLYITSKNIRMGRLSLEDVSYIPDYEHQRIYLASPVKYGDVLLTKDGAKTGNVCLNTLQEEFSLLSSVAYLRGKTDLLLNKFLLQWLSSPRVQYDIKNDMAGQAITRLTLQKIGKFKILLPPLPEQKAIAELLSTWDEAIEKTERLIQTKEERFKWLLRELISEPRNSQKVTGWKNVLLGDVCKVTKGKQLNVEHMKDDGEYYALNGGIEPSGRTDDWNTEADTITISEGGNSCGYINYNTERFWSGGHCYSLKKLKSDIDRHYLYFYLKMNEPKLMSLRVGSGLPNIQKKDVDKFVVVLPPLPNQQQIAEVLSSAQEEIDLLKQLAEQYKTQKRGLMQRVLTGIWRMAPDAVMRYE